MKRPPSLCRNKAKDFAYVYINRKQVYLGKWGSAEAQGAYDRLVIEWAKSNGQVSVDFARDGALLVELVTAFAEEYKARPQKSLSDYYAFVDIGLRLGKLFPDKFANDFRIRDLEMFRDSLQEAGFERKGEHQEYTRTYLNKAVNRVKTIFSWGVTKEMVSAEACSRLKFLPPLRRGRTTAPEPPSRHLIPDSDYTAVCEFLPSYYLDIVTILRLTGMRPSELANMRIGDIDKSGDVWLYHPEHHKTEYRGNHRAVPFGKKVQTVLEKHLSGRNPDEYVFTASRAMISKWRDRRDQRKTKIQPSQMERGKKSIEEKVARYGNKMDPNTIGRIVSRACQKAIKAKKLSQPWTPYELRHTAITEVRTKFGAEAAQHFAGHSNLDTQKFYDHSAIETASAVAREIG